MELGTLRAESESAAGGGDGSVLGAELVAQAGAGSDPASADCRYSPVGQKMNTHTFHSLVYIKGV